MISRDLNSLNACDGPFFIHKMLYHTKESVSSKAKPDDCFRLCIEVPALCNLDFTDLTIATDRRLVVSLCKGLTFEQLIILVFLRNKIYILFSTFFRSFFWTKYTITKFL